jgi:hypothetical protein
VERDALSFGVHTPLGDRLVADGEIEDRALLTN